MSRQIAQLLGIEDSAAERAITRLEALSGCNGEDNRLLAEIKSKLRHKVAQLGLDPYDTTPRELYHCLLAHVEKDSVFFDQHINGRLAPGKNSLKNIVRLVELGAGANVFWVLKRSVAKDLLRRHQPKKLMRRLGYRSIDSMLKREDIDGLHAAAAFEESLSWQKTLIKAYSFVSPQDFELRKVSLLIMGSRFGPHSSKALSNVPELGVIAFWPPAGQSSAHRLGTFLSAMFALESIQISSLSLMSQQVRKDFGRVLSKQAENRDYKITELEGLPINWRAIFHHYGHLPRRIQPALGEPYVDKGGMFKLSPFKALASLHPVFRWWQDNDYLSASPGGTPLSLNLADNIHNFISQNRFSERYARHLRSGLYDELISRYLGHPGVEDIILQKVDRHLAAAMNRRAVYLPEVQKELQTV